MNSFGDFITVKKPERPKELPVPTQPAKPSGPRTELVVEANDPNYVKVINSDGRESFVAKSGLERVFKWRVRACWGNLEKIGPFAAEALKGGYFSYFAAVAERECRSLHPEARRACFYGTVLLKGNELDAAEKVLQNYLAAYGENDSVLTKLAEVYLARNELQKARETVWSALEIDPNLPEAMGWYEKTHCEEGGVDAGLEALRRVAALPGSWLAQLWLARQALQARHLEEALALYKECLARVSKPFPGELLLQMSGDLGNAGHLPELLRLAEPHFDGRTHGPQVGNNLIKALVDLGQFDAARRVLDRLYALKGVTWKECLNFWDREILKAEVATCGPIDRSARKIVILTAEGPVWLGPMAAELFPGKAADALVIGFLGGSVEPGNDSEQIGHTLSDKRSRMSRALPLFFAEQIEFHSRARAKILQPWSCVANERSVVVFRTKPWKDEDVAIVACQGNAKSDYVVISHLRTQVEPWTVELRLVRTIDSKCLGTLSGDFAFHGRQEEMPELAQRLLGLLAEHAEVDLQPAPSIYQIPMGMEFSVYLRRLESLMALRCSGIKSLQPYVRCGVRNVIGAQINRCEADPQNVCARLLLAEILLSVKLAQPHVLEEFQERIERLQKEKLLTEPAHGVVQRMMDKAFAKQGGT